MTRNEIIKEALEWQGTRWQHQASLKGIACDCAGFVRGVFKNLTGTDVPIEADYPATWHLFQKEERCYNTCKKYLTEIKITDIMPGDVILFAYRKSFVAHHMGIVLPNNKFIHADQDVGLVHVTAFDDTWKSRMRYAFKFNEVK